MTKTIAKLCLRQELISLITYDDTNQLALFLALYIILQLLNFVIEYVCAKKGVEYYAKEN